MFLGNLSRDSIASSLLKTISTNNNGHKKTTPLKGSTKQTPTSCSTNTESLWNYSDVFGQEWEEGLGTAHRVFAEDRRTTPVTGLSQGKLREPNKEKPTKPSVPKKGSEGTTFAVENSPISRQKVGYTTERVSQKSSFKEELEAWRHRSVQSISSESKGFVREPLDITVVSKWPKKRGYNNDLAHRNDKKEAKKIDKESSEEEENSDKEVYTFEDLMREEERSARIAAKEDAEEYRKEQERKRKKQLKRTAAKKKRE